MIFGPFKFTHQRPDSTRANHSAGIFFFRIRSYQYRNSKVCSQKMQKNQSALQNLLIPFLRHFQYLKHWQAHIFFYDLMIFFLLLNCIVSTRHYAVFYCLNTLNCRFSRKAQYTFNCLYRCKSSALTLKFFDCSLYDLYYFQCIFSKMIQNQRQNILKKSLQV